MVVVGDVGDIDCKLMIDGVAVHAVMIVIALIFYGHSRAVGPISSMAGGPPVNEGFECTRWEVSPIWKRGIYACVAGIYILTRSGCVGCETGDRVGRGGKREEADWVTKSPVRHKLYRVLLTK
jgi:hypothetical protein